MKKIIKTYNHKPEVEKHLFSDYIDSLLTYPGFSDVWENGGDFEISLKDLGIYCPKKHVRLRQYNRFLRFLITKHINLTIKSQKSEYKVK